jgi:hypothetical protein
LPTGCRGGDRRLPGLKQKGRAKARLFVHIYFPMSGFDIQLAAIPGFRKGCPGGGDPPEPTNYFFFLAFAFLAFFTVLAFFAFFAIASSQVGWIVTPHEACWARASFATASNAIRTDSQRRRRAVTPLRRRYPQLSRLLPG